MSTINLPKSEYVPHPVGRYTGCIVNVEDKGKQETPFGLKHKLAIRIDCDSQMMANGEPYSVTKWYTVSSHPKSNLTKLREMVLGRKLTGDEISTMETTDELIDKRIVYLVVHNEGRDGGTFAVINEIWPVEDKPVAVPPAAKSIAEYEDLPF